MDLRCLLFTSDEGTALSVCQALTDLSVESEHCTVAVEAVQKVTNNPFNLLIVDWDSQSEASFLLKTARERKASERPLTLAIVSGDLNVSQALQAGANSILRKPIVVAQVHDSLTSARDLVKSRQDASAASSQAAAAAASTTGPTLPTDLNAPEKTLRAGEFLQSTTAPGAQFVTEGDVQNKTQKRTEEAAEAEIALKDLESMAAAAETNEVDPQPVTSGPAEPRGLSWYMKARGATLSPPPSPATPPKPELLSFEQVSSSAETHKEAPPVSAAADPAASSHADSGRKIESALFAYMSGESSAESEPEVAKSRPSLRRSIFVGALVGMCAIAYVTVPQPRWHQNMQMLASTAAYFAHNLLLNPQATTPVQVPTTHENFGLAGDEYKLPFAQNIPDATTDPTQIRVVPVVDPTAKQPNGAASNASSTVMDTSPTENSTPTPTDEQPPVQVQETAQPDATSTVADDSSSSSAPAPPRVVAEPSPADISKPNVTPARRDPMRPVPLTNSRPQPAPVATSSKPAAGIPSSLKSQIASMTPDAGGNKPVEASLPSIEPVDLPEATARGLLLQQSQPAYPEAAKGQHGSVVLQVLVARDGSVQDAKFLQGSLAFARAATDAVKQWRFKPYNLNGRPVATRTVLTLTFKPTS